ncbi:MAG: TonB-dependent receptor [Bacteroidetes bacterium]|nr:TonB-dependent receptor [Bacteroidota bacterium]
MNFPAFKHLIIIIFVLLCFNYINAQTNDVTISGFVTDASTGEALIGANILLYSDTVNVNNRPLRGTSTNRYGFYALPKITSGKYFVIYRSLGYKTVVNEFNVTLTSGIVKNNVEMIGEEVQIDEVLVKAQKEKDILISKIDIPEAILKQLPSLSGEIEIFKSLAMLPGVQTASEISSGLYIRGGSPDQTLTLVDGMVLYNPSHLGNFTSTFNSNALQDLRLIKGAFPAEYGGRLSSVLDITLRSGSKEKDKGTIGLGAINSFITMEGPLTDNSTYMIAGRGMYYDAFQKTFNNESSVPRYNFYDINSKFTYSISENDVVSLSAFFSRDHLYSPGNASRLIYDISWQNGAFNINWLQNTSKSVLTNTTVSYINYEFKSILDDDPAAVSASDYFSKSILNDFLIRKSFDFYWHEDHTIKTGIDFSIHNYDIVSSNFYDVNFETNELLREQHSAKEASFYLQNESHFSSLFSTNIGLRLYYFSESKFFDFEPRISLSFSLTQDLSIKAAYATAHQFLHLLTRNDKSLPTDLWLPSSKNIDPSRSTQYVAGIEQLFDNQKYLVSIEAYYRDMKNLYEFKESSDFNYAEPIYTQLTKGEGEAYGLEFFLNKRSGDFTGWIGYSMAWTRRLFPDLNAGKIFYPRYDRRHDVSVVLAYAVTENFSVSLTWLYATGQGFTLPFGQYQFEDILPNPNSEIKLDYSERNGYKLPDYHKLDINFSYKFNFMKLPFEIYCNLLNVYNRQNAFAHYVTIEDSGGGKNVPVQKQITLFPFIPTVGLKVDF